MKPPAWPRPSTRAFTREARRIPGYTFFDWLHGYVYMRWPYLYIGTAVGAHPLARLIRPVSALAERISALVPKTIGSAGPRSGPVTAADTYHGKVVTLESATRLVTVGRNIELRNLEHVIPYALARDLVLQDPDHIAVIECPCRVAREHPCLPLDVCLIVGEPFASFVLEHQGKRSRRITPDEAVEILRAEHERGHVQHAFFKAAVLGRFYAICNCCSCCCGAMQARRNGVPMLASSGYVSQVDPLLCAACGACEASCQFGAIHLVDGCSVVDPAACMGCGVCVEKCDQGALSLVRDESRGVPLEIDALMDAALKAQPMFSVPASLADPVSLPPVIHTAEPGSFAHNTLRVRVPGILRETIALNDFPAPIRAALDELHAELISAPARGLREDAPDRAFWDAVSAPYVGHTWLDVPWYWAEAFFYRRVLEAIRYFQPGPWFGFDPFAAKKRTEWAAGVAPAAVAGLLAHLPVDPCARFERVLHASLWGNRTDLSYEVASHLGRASGVRDERANLLVDDTERLWAALQARPRRLAIIADNAGTELLMDFALVDHLLAAGLAGEIHLHLKPQPFFVSDATVRDALDGLAALASGSAATAALGMRLKGYLAAGRLRFRTHWLYATSLFYFQLPDDLLAELAAMDLVLVKGDANYRRLLGDAHWPAATPFAAAAGYFPAPLAALRTLKGEIIVGLPPGEAERLSAEDPAWLVNGRRGIIQARL